MLTETIEYALMTDLKLKTLNNCFNKTLPLFLKIYIIPYFDALTDINTCLITNIPNAM